MRLYCYRAQPLRVVDGDTYDFMVDLGFRVHHKIRVRLLGVNTPELRDGVKGIEARDFASDWLADVTEAYGAVLIRTTKTDSFGRWLADPMSTEGAHLSTALLDAGLAEEYEE